MYRVFQVAERQEFSDSFHAPLMFEPEARHTLLADSPPFVRRPEMQILIVTFGLDGHGDADYRAACIEEAPTFAALPGLVSKTWLANQSTNTYGGVYAFADRDALDAYLASDLFKGFATDPAFPNLTATAFEILDAPSAITHGLGAIEPVAA